MLAINNAIEIVRVLLRPNRERKREGKGEGEGVSSYIRHKLWTANHETHAKCTQRDATTLRCDCLSCLFIYWCGKLPAHTRTHILTHTQTHTGCISCACQSPGNGRGHRRHRHKDASTSYSHDSEWVYSIARLVAVKIGMYPISLPSISWSCCHGRQSHYTYAPLQSPHWVRVQCIIRLSVSSIVQAGQWLYNCTGGTTTHTADKPRQEKERIPSNPTRNKLID